MFIEKLTETNSHLATSRSRCCDNDKRTGSLDIVILAKSLIRGNERHIVRIAFNEIMAIGADAFALEPMSECYGCRLTVVMCHHNRAHHEAHVLELIAQPQHILIVGNAQISAFLILLNIGRADDNHDFYAVAQLLKHSQLAIGLKSRQHPACMMIVKQFPSQFKIQFAIKLRDALPDMLRLDALVLFVVKSYFHIDCKVTLFFCNIHITLRVFCTKKSLDTGLVSRPLSREKSYMPRDD